MNYKVVNINSVSKSDYQYYYSLMSPEKKARVDRYKSEVDKMRSVTGEMLARIMISEACKTNPENTVFNYGKNGKPYAVDLSCEFNISHSGDYVICAINDSPIGADIEQIRNLSVYPDIIFTDKEKEYVFGADNEAEINKRFFEIWTFKEAIIKLRGQALSGLKETDCFNYDGNREIIATEDYIATIVY